LGLAGTICHRLLSVSACSLSCASDTEGFSGSPPAGNSNAGAVGGNVCSEVVGSSENGAMMPFDVYPQKQATLYHFGAFG
jgi:hypothetical protein